MFLFHLITNILLSKLVVDIYDHFYIILKIWPFVDNCTINSCTCMVILLYTSMFVADVIWYQIIDITILIVFLTPYYGWCLSLAHFGLAVVLTYMEHYEVIFENYQVEVAKIM